MKDFIRNFKIPIILGGCALIAIIATLFVVTGGGAKYGLYIVSATGSVSVTNGDEAMGSSVGDALKNGDVLTVGEDSSCKLAYKGKKNSENNYLVVGENSQLVSSSDFDGKGAGELFLRTGDIIGNFAEDDRCPIIIRTADATVTTAKSVSKISYRTNEFMSYTDLYTFMGDSEIQLYDSLGAPVNNAELQIEKKWGRVVSEDGPSFEALNLDFELDELSAYDLKTLISIASTVGEGFPYTAEELKAAYDLRAEDETDDAGDTGTETSAAEATDSSDTIQTAEPIVTTAPPMTETTVPGHTTAAPVTTAAAVTTAPEQTTTAASVTETAASGVTHTVTIVVDGEETLQDVAHGEDAVRPEDPVVEGMTFIGWDGSFENITEDRIITAMFSEILDGDTETTASSTPSATSHTVTVVIGNRSNTIEVEHGQSANLPNTLDIEGYVFKGWDKDFTNITADVTITAILVPTKHTVTFVIENDRFTVEAEHNGSVLPPYIPSADSGGNRFVGWDKPLDNIIGDTTITAVFADDNYHMVTFIIDGEFYSVRVADGEAAVPPFLPIADKNGNRFTGWDKTFDNITSDITITAYFG